jgi:integrase
VYWAMAYDTAARADELLGLDVQNIDLPDRCAIIIGKGGSAERIFWSSITARRLPRLIHGRTTGPGGPGPAPRPQ